MAPSNGRKNRSDRIVLTLANLHSLITRIEAWPVTPAQAVLTFLAIVLLRYGLESLLEARHVLALHLDLRPGLTDFLHVLVSWAVLYGLLAFGLAVFSGRGLARANRMALACFPLIWLPPLFDFAFGYSGEIVYQHDFSLFAASFVGLFNPTVTVAYVTPGVRVEVACAVILAALYCGLARRSPVRAALAGLWTYGVVFLLGFLPAIWFFLLGGDQSVWLGRSVLRVTGAEAPLLWYLPLAVVLFPLWLRASHRGLWAAFLASLRPSRLAVYLAICALAFHAATRVGLVGWDWLNPYDLGEVLLLNLALLLAFVAMTILNDLYDQEIDAVSNRGRPLPAGSVSAGDFAVLGGVCAVLALWLAVVVDEVAVYPLAMIFALGYLYSAPPLRLRRFVGVAHLLLAGIAVCVYLYGASPILGNLAFQQINKTALLALALLFFFGAHFKDIKDAEGDRLAGVTTLATLFGASRAYWITGGLLVVALPVLVVADLLANRPATWAAIALFIAGWLYLRNAERMFWVMLAALAVLFVG